MSYLTKLILPSLLLLLLFVSCKKKSADDNDGSSNNGDRLISMIIYLNSVVTGNQDYFYTGDRLDSIVYYDEQAGEKSKWINSWENGLVKKVTYYSKGVNTYPAVWTNEVTQFTNDLPAEILHTDLDAQGNVTTMTKYTYTWSGNLLILADTYNQDAGDWILGREYTLKYTGTLRNELSMHDWSGNSSDGKITYSYDGSVLKEEIIYMMDSLGWTAHHRTLCDKTGDLITKMTAYFPDGTGWLSNGYSLFNYNSTGNVTLQTFYNSGNYAGKHAYIYTTGSSLLEAVHRVSQPEWFVLTGIAPDQPLSYIPF